MAFQLNMNGRHFRLSAIMSMCATHFSSGLEENIEKVQQKRVEQTKHVKKIW